MINFTTIDTEFAEIVGFIENEDVVLNTSLTTSNTGFYVNNEAGISLQTVSKSLYRYASTSLPDLTGYLSQKRAAGIREVIGDLLTQNVELTKSRSILDNVILPGGTPDDLMTDKNNRLVGIRIRPKNSRHAAVLIKKIGYYFQSTQTDINIYMWVEGRKAPIKTYTINSITGNSRDFSSIEDENWIAQYYSTYGSGVTFYIGYFESDLNGSAYNTSLNNSDNKNDVYKSLYTHYAEICGFAVANSKLDNTNLPNIEDIEYTDSTFGLYLWLNIECDITNILIDNKKLFGRAINAKIAWDINEDLINSPNLGHRTETAQNQTAENNRNTLHTIYTLELKQMTIDFSKLDQYCLSADRFTFRTRTA